MAAISQPYEVILAGAHEAGKTVIFTTIKEGVEESFSFKSLSQERKGHRFDFCVHEYSDSKRRTKPRVNSQCMLCGGCVRF